MGVQVSVGRISVVQVLRVRAVSVAQVAWEAAALVRSVVQDSGALAASDVRGSTHWRFEDAGLAIQASTASIAVHDSADTVSRRVALCGSCHDTAMARSQ